MSSVTGVEENGAKIEASNSTTNRYRQAIHFKNTNQEFDFNKQYSGQTEWLPISSSSQYKRKIKIRNKSSINMYNFLETVNNASIEPSTATETIGRVTENVRDIIASNTIKPNALGLNIVNTKKKNGIDISEDNSFEKNQIGHTDNNLIESFIHNSLPNLKSTASSYIIHSKYPNSNSSNKYFNNNSQNEPQHWHHNSNHWNSHNNQYIIVEDVDPAYLPKPPPPPQPPWYEHHTPSPWHESYKPTPEPWHDHSTSIETWHEHHSSYPNTWDKYHSTSTKPWSEQETSKPELPSVVVHSEITYFPPVPHPEHDVPSPEPHPEYSYTPIPQPETSPEPTPQHNYQHVPYRPEPSPEIEHYHPHEQTKPSKPVYNDPVFVEPNTPIFITPVSITNIQNNPLNPIVATNGEPPPSIVVLEDLSVTNDSPAGSGLNGSMGTTLTGSVTLADPGAGAGAGAAAGSSGGAGPAVAAAAAAGAAGSAAAAASSAVATGITGGVVGSAASGSTAICNNIEVNTFNRQGIQCPPVNINVLSSGDIPPDEVDDDSSPPAQAPPATQVDTPEDGGIIVESFSLFEYLSSMFGAINVLNPVGFAFWALMFAPLSILVTSGLGAVAFFFPWLFPRLWLGRSFRNRRSLQNETDLLFYMNKRLDYDLDYLENLLLTMESKSHKFNFNNLKQRRKRK